AELRARVSPALTYVMRNVERREAQALPDAQKDMLASVGRGAERIQGLAQSLLAFSRPGQEELLPLNANDVIERSLELCHYQILKSGVELQKRLDPALPEVKGVSNQLEMALINLVVNAIHAMDQGGRLTVSSTAREGGVEIAGADT